jgi:aspartate racemase
MLPTDRPRPAVQNLRGAIQSVSVPESLAAQLKALSQREGTTLFCTLLAAFATLLYRWTGQRDILIGTPVAGRTRAELERMIGLFVNTLVLRTDLKNDPRFRELLAGVHAAALDAWAHQDLPFEKLVEQVEGQRDLSRAPLFQVMFILQNTPTEGLALPGLAVAPFPVSNESAKFDLLLDLTETGQGLQGTLQYNTDLFESATVGRFLLHFENVLAEIASDPSQRISTLPILSADEQRLLAEWNDTSVSWPQDDCLPELIEAQVRRSPDAVALEFDGQQLTDAELNRKANQLARHLRSLGVGPETRVGLCLNRSIEMVVAVLGVLKAGAAYVPMDPGQPRLCRADQRTVGGVAAGARGASGLPRPDRAGWRRREGRESRLEGRQPNPLAHHLHVGFHGATEGRRNRTAQCRHPRAMVA